MKKDFYQKKAGKEGYYSRAAYKLMQINKKFRLIDKGDKVLDIGCCPGGWSQIALEVVGDKGYILGIDLNKPKVKNDKFEFLKVDIEEFETNKKFDVVISDIAPSTTGVRDLDGEVSYDLSLNSLKIALKVLKKRGNFLVKVFDSDKTKNLVKLLNKNFSYYRIYKPLASKKSSREVYLIGKNFK